MAIDPETIKPSLSEVAAHIIHRTRVGYSDGGVPVGPGTDEAGTFNARTSPTDVQVGLQIGRSARYVALELGKPGTSWDGSLEDTARDVVALHAALQIESGFAGDGSMVEASTDQLGRMFREQRDALLLTAQNNQVGGFRFGSIRTVTSQRVLDEEAQAAQP